MTPEGYIVFVRELPDCFDVRLCHGILKGGEVLLENGITRAYFDVCLFQGCT